MDTQRYCCDCDTPLTTNNTYQKVTNRCKGCHNRRAVDKQKSNPKFREQVLLNSARYRAKRDGIPFDLTLEDIVIPEVCPVLGIPLHHNTSRGTSDNSPTLDKIIPELGYVRGNIAVMSAKANRIKSNASLADLAAVTRWMLAVSP